ncbi:MAG: metallophosphoesterase family protein [Lachnospiraceae bacterium]|nr:metallophosphoesterase family protein [Lachnospiraceae bacterium]
MSRTSRISKAFQDALLLPLEHCSRYILFSDCHRGIGNANDNFLKNEYLYLAALNYYYHQGFTYLELGDGDELWENRSLYKIKEMHGQCFAVMAKFYAEGRFYAIYGNHDMVKKNPDFPEKHFRTYYCEHTMCPHPLFPNITFYPGIILHDCQGKKDIYLIHGHQADPLNSSFWRLARFLVRYIWKPLEGLGVPDPTSAAKNNRKKKQSEQLLSDWAVENHHILITGHTHHPMAGNVHSPYLNTGSCIHPSGITGIEIENRCMTLVKWSIAARSDLSLYASRDILGETVCIDEILT